MESLFLVAWIFLVPVSADFPLSADVIYENAYVKFDKYPLRTEHRVNGEMVVTLAIRRQKDNALLSVTAQIGKPMVILAELKTTDGKEIGGHLTWAEGQVCKLKRWFEKQVNE